MTLTRADFETKILRHLLTYLGSYPPWVLTDMTFTDFDNLTEEELRNYGNARIGIILELVRKTDSETTR